jgi:hypothetical protein
MPVILHKSIVAVFNAATEADLIQELEEYIRTHKPVPPVTPPVTPFIGEQGELLKKDLTTPEFFAWVSATTPALWTTPPPTIDDENENWTIAGCNRRIRRALKELPPKLAAAAREFAKTHKYGRAPDELVAEYLYVRWMSALEREVHYAATTILSKLPGRFHIIDYMDSKLYRREVFEKKRLELAAKLIKEHGWKAPTRGSWAGVGSFAGTEFQTIAIDSKSATFTDGRNIANEVYVFPTSMDYSELIKMIKDDII